MDKPKLNLGRLINWQLFTLVVVLTAGVVIASFIFADKHQRIHLPGGRYGRYLDSFDGRVLVGLYPPRDPSDFEDLLCYNSETLEMEWSCCFPPGVRDGDHYVDDVALSRSGNTIYVSSPYSFQLFEIDLDNGYILGEGCSGFGEKLHTMTVGDREYLICISEHGLEVFEAADLQNEKGKSSAPVGGEPVYAWERDSTDIRGSEFIPDKNQLVCLTANFDTENFDQNAGLAVEITGTIRLLSFTNPGNELHVEVKEQTTGEPAYGLIANTGKSTIEFYSVDEECFKIHDLNTLDCIGSRPRIADLSSTTLRNGKQLELTTDKNIETDEVSGQLMVLDQADGTSRELLLDGRYPVRIIPDDDQETVTIWNRGTSWRSLEREGSLFQRIFTPRSCMLSTKHGYKDCSLIQVDLESVQVVREISIPDGSLRYSADENRIYLSDRDGEFIEIIDL